MKTNLRLIGGRRLESSRNNDTRPTTLMIFKGGQKVDTVVGAVPKATLSSTLSKHL